MADQPEEDQLPSAVCVFLAQINYTAEKGEDGLCVFNHSPLPLCSVVDLKKNSAQWLLHPALCIMRKGVEILIRGLWGHEHGLKLGHQREEIAEGASAIKKKHGLLKCKFFHE